MKQLTNLKIAHQNLLGSQEDRHYIHLYNKSAVILNRLMNPLKTRTVIKKTDGQGAQYSYTWTSRAISEINITNTPHHG